MVKRSKERRAHPRIRVSFALKVKQKADVLVAATQDLSRSGIMCALPGAIRPMTRVQISLCLPPLGSGPNEGEKEIRAEGVVVRSDPDKKGRYQTAIFFPELHEEDALWIDRFVRHRPGKPSE